MTWGEKKPTPMKVTVHPDERAGGVLRGQQLGECSGCDVFQLSPGATADLTAEGI